MSCRFQVTARQNCHGHGDLDSSGDCDCQHSTAGDTCDACLPLYNGAAYSRWKVDNQYACEACDCNEHADSCQYSEEIEGGVCDDCQHNTAGELCGTCAAGYFRPADADPTSEDSCQGCDCSIAGTTASVCQRDVFNSDSEPAGTCICKENTEDDDCGTCSEGYYNLAATNDAGCEACDSCNAAGRADEAECADGTCECKENVGGVRCEVCNDGFYGLRADNSQGCGPCQCHAAGTVGGVSTNCDGTNGQCACATGWAGRACDECADSFFMEDGACVACGCDSTGSASTVCSSSGECECIDGYAAEKCDACADEFTQASDGSCVACTCNADGSTSNVCDKTNAACSCKQFVIGAQCDECAADFSNLDGDNADGCSGTPTEFGIPAATLSDDGNSVAVSWSAPAGYAGPITSYQVLRSVALSGASPDELYVGTDTSHTDSSVNPGITYIYQVVANTAATSGGAVSSPERTVSTPHALPADLDAPTLTESTNSNTATMVWDAPASPNGVPLTYKIQLNHSGAVGSEISTNELRRFTYDGLLFNVDYIAAIAACNDAGCAWSAGLEFTTGVTTATGLAAPALSANFGPSRLQVTWSAAEFQNGDLLGYRLRYGVEGSSSLTTVNAGTNEVFMITNLEASTSYVVHLDSYTREVGTPATASATQQTPQASPEDMVDPEVAASGPEAIEVTFSAPGTPNGDITNYSVLVDGTVVHIATSVGATTITGLSAFTSYTITLQACIAEGCSSSNGVDVRTDPAAPTGQGAPSVQARGDAIEISWEGPESPSGVIQTYTVYRDGSALRTVSADTLSLNDTDFSPYTVYTYTVAARSEQGAALSDGTAITTPQILATGLQSPVVAAGSGYAVDVTIRPPSRMNGILSQYSLQLTTADGTTSTVYTGTGLFTSIGEADLSPFSTYRVRTTVTNGAGATVSSPATFTTAEAAPDDFENGPALGSSTSSSLTVTWSFTGAMNGELTRANVLFGEDGNFSVNHVSGENSHTVSNLAAYTEYAVSIELCTAAGCTESPSTTLTTLGIVPGAFEENITVTALDPYSVQIQWSAPPSSNQPLLKFQVWRSGDLARELSDVSATSYVDRSDGVQPNTLYRYTVVAFNNVGNRSSNTAAAVTPEGTPDGVYQPTATADGSTILDFVWVEPRSPHGVIVNYTLVVDGVITCTRLVGQVSQMACSVSDLSAFTAYQVTLQLCNSAGCAQSEAAAIRTGEADPEGLAAPAYDTIEAEEIDVVWVAPTNPYGVIQYYELWAQGDLTADAYNGLLTESADPEAETSTASSSDATAFDMLDESNHQADTIPSTSAGVFMFDGNQGLPILGYPGVDSTFSVYLEFTATSDNAGYLFAKCTASTRYYSLYYTDASDQLYFFYRIAGSTSNRFVRFSINVNDGAAHQLLLSVDGNSASVTLDDNDVLTQALLGNVDDCGEPADDCLLLLGQRASNQESRRNPYRGNMSAAVLYPSAALTEFPSGLATTAASDSSGNTFTRVYRGASTGVTLDNLRPYTTYTMYLKAFNSVGGVTSASSQVQLLSARPGGVAAPSVDASGTSIAIGWAEPTYPNGDMSNYVLYQLSPNAAQLYNGTGMEFTVQGALSYQLYRFRIEAQNQAGGTVSAMSVVMTPSAPPDGVSVPTVAAVGSSSGTIAWEEPENVNAPAMVNYTVSVDSVATQTERGNATQSELTGLSPFTSYTISVTACNAAGCTQSESIQLTTNEFGPGGQGDVTLDTLSYTSINVSWSPPSDPNGQITRYELWRRTTGRRESPPEQETMIRSSLDLWFVATNLLTAREYEFRVVSHNSQGSSPSPWSQAYTLPDAAPLECGNVTATSIAVAWEPSIAGVSVALWSRSAGTSEAVAYDGDDSSVSLDGLAPYTIYRYRTFACNSGGCNTSAAVQCRTLQGQPTGIETPTATAASTQSFALAWSAPATPNGVITAYIIRLYQLNQRPETINLASDLRSYVISRDYFQPYSQYTFSLLACNSAACSDGVQFQGRTAEAVPDSQPNPVMSTPNGSVYVEWEEPPQPNGILLDYMVYFRRSRNEARRNRRQIGGGGEDDDFGGGGDDEGGNSGGNVGGGAGGATGGMAGGNAGGGAGGATGGNGGPGEGDDEGGDDQQQGDDFGGGSDEGGDDQGGGGNSGPGGPGQGEDDGDGDGDDEQQGGDDQQQGDDFGGGNDEGGDDFGGGGDDENGNSGGNSGGNVGGGAGGATGGTGGGGGG